MHLSGQPNAFVATFRDDGYILIDKPADVRIDGPCGSGMLTVQCHNPEFARDRTKVAYLRPPWLTGGYRPRHEHTATKLLAGVDEGLLSFCLPHSHL